MENTYTLIGITTVSIPCMMQLCSRSQSVIQSAVVCSRTVGLVTWSSIHSVFIVPQGSHAVANPQDSLQFICSHLTINKDLVTSQMTETIRSLPHSTESTASQCIHDL